MGKVYKNGIVSPKGFDMSAPEPVDQREIVENKVDLLTLQNVYLGIEVKVRSEGYKEYKLVATPSDNYDNWILVQGGDAGANGSFVSSDGKTVTVINGLIVSII